MFIDSSAFLAILLAEPEGQDFLVRLAGQRKKPITSPVVRFEVVVSLARSGKNGGNVNEADLALAAERFDELLKLLECSEVLVTTKAGRIAVEAAAIYGKVAGHPAKLNMGDCLSYGVAKANNVPLLYKGKDFVHTDLG